MATITPVTVQRGQSLLILWPGLDAVDDGTAVDVSRYTELSVIFRGTFADTDAMALQGASGTKAGAVGTFTTLQRLESNANLSTSANLSAKVEKLGGVKWIKPQGGGSTGVGTSAVNVIVMASRPAQ